MVDYQSRYRMYGHGYISPELRYPVTTYRELYHETASRLFKRRPTVYIYIEDEPEAHDCREDAVRDGTRTTDWETYILSQGLRQTSHSVDELHRKDVDKRPGSGKKKPDKLIFNISGRGAGDYEFNYPRGLTVNMDGDVIVADTSNNRIKVLSSFGVFKTKFGKKGAGNGQFDEPTGVTELPNGDLAVADKNNKRVQVFTSNGTYKYEFPTVHRPYCIANDSKFNIAVSTTHGTIEVYRRGGKLVGRFEVNNGKRKQQGKFPWGMQVCCNDKGEVVVCDPSDCYVKFFTYDGTFLYKFEPLSNNVGLAIFPSAICRTPLDQYIIGDSLNHTVNLYTERGILLKQLLCPTDDAGPVQTCALGPEGHLVVTEFNVTGTHSVKIFRYRDCPCHENRPGSSKRRTPTTPI